MFFYSRVPFGLYALLVLIIIPVGIYEFNTKTKKKCPNHPGKYMIYPGSLYLIVACFKKFYQEYSIGELWVKIIDISMIVTGALFVLGFGYMSYRLIKDGYYTREELDKLKRKLTPLLVMFLVCAVLLIIMRIW